MLKKIVALLLFLFVCFNAEAQDEPALIGKFSKEISKNLHEDALADNKNLILHTITEKKEKSSKKKTSKYLKKLKEELSFLASTIKHNNYSLLNKLIANGYFKKIAFNATQIQKGDAIELTINSNKSIGLEDILANYPSIKENHIISVVEDINETKAKDYKVKYAANDADYAKYLLKQIEDLLDDHKKELECKFKAYIAFEASKQYTQIEQTIALRQHFITFCWERIE